MKGTLKNVTLAVALAAACGLLVAMSVPDRLYLIPAALGVAVVFWTVPVVGVWIEERRKGVGDTLKNVAPVVLVAAAWALLIAIALPDRLYLMAVSLGAAAWLGVPVLRTWAKERRARNAQDGAETRVRTTAH